MLRTPPADAPVSRPALALLAAAVAAASFVSMDSLIKLISPRYGTFQLTFFRFASGSFYAIVLWLWHRPPLPERRWWGMHVLRSCFLLLSLLGYFHGLTVLPLAQTVAISYLAPIFVSLLAMIALHERPSRWIWLALVLGLGGVMSTLAPELRRSFEGASPQRAMGIASVAGAAFAFSVVMVLARKQAQHDSMWSILLVQNVLPLLLLSAPAAASWRPLQLPDLAPIALAGVFATVGLLSLTWAFTHLEASRVAPLEYTSFVWASALGYALFGELPSASTGLSALLIVGGCLLLLRR